MTRKPISTPSILRYVYAILGVIVIASIVAIGSLYVGQNDELTTHDRVQNFYLESYAEAERLSREVQTLRDFAAQSLVLEESNVTGLARRYSVRIGYEGIRHSMRSRLSNLASLQAQYDGAVFVSTLERLVNRFEQIDTAFRNASINPDTITAIEVLSTTIQQFGRLHTIAVDNELQRLAERQSRRPRFLAVLLVSLGFSVAATWYFITSLRRSLSRQKKIERDLADAEERLNNIRKLDALGKLVGGIAHDFNNLLTSILGNTELLQEQSTRDKNVQSGLNEIRTAGLRAASLTQQLLAFSRQQQANRRIMDLNEFLRGMEGMLQRTVGAGIKLICDYSADPYAVELDPSQLQQVIMNLINNARDAMPNGGVLSIATENIVVNASTEGLPDGEYVRLTVADTGVGMDEETRRRLFEPFFTTKELGQGTGLGLSMVHGIVTDSKGHVVVHSRAGEGALFHIYFRRAEGRVDEQPDMVEPLPAQKGAETILVVDDDEQIVRFVEKGLSSLGYQVLTASGGSNGLRLCETHDGPIHVIVSDVVMSGTNGPAFMESARRLRPDAAAIFISGYTDVLWRNKGSDEIPLIEKPFELELLSRHIRNSLNKFDDTRSSSAS